MNYLNMAKEIKEMKQKYKDEFKHIKSTVIEPTLRWSLKQEKAEERKSLEGNYVLKTSRKDLTDSDIWNTYVMLTRVEKAFRNLKSDLALRPNPHHKEHRTDGHVFISILAYHLLHAIEYSIRQKGMNVWWSSIKRVMSSHCYSTIIAPTVKGLKFILRC
jgi:transposase